MVRDRPDKLREDFELQNVDFLRNFFVRGLTPPSPPYFRELQTFWDTFDFGHKKGAKKNLQNIQNDQI